MGFRTDSVGTAGIVTALMLLLTTSAGAEERFPLGIRVKRLPGNPIIAESMLSAGDGDSMNGPSLIRVPSWVQNPMGRYYLYFAHHAGKYIRLAYADKVEGPWKLHAGGAIRIEDQKALAGHIASPEAIVDEVEKKIYLYYHGRPSGIAKQKGDPEAGQKSSVAVSTDGLHFRARDVKVGPAYLRVFRHKGYWCAINGHGTLLRSSKLGVVFENVGDVIGDGIAAAIDPVALGEEGARKDRPASGGDRYSIRHVGVDIVGSRLVIYFSCVGHRPERIYATQIELKGDASSWRAEGVLEVMRPEEEWEGAKLPAAFSRGGRSRAWENGLRDPAIYREDGKTWLLYSSAGEHGIGIAELQYEAAAR